MGGWNCSIKFTYLRIVCNFSSYNIRSFWWILPNWWISGPLCL